MNPSDDSDLPAKSFVERSLRDNNGDGFADDLDLKFVVRENLDTPTWYSLINLAARLSLSSSGFSPPLVLSVEPGSENCLVVERGDNEKLERLFVESLPEEDATQQMPVVAERARSRNLDLSLPWTIDGFLVDRDDDQLGDDSALHIVLPQHVTRDLGVSIVNFACRTGIETTALRFPLASAEALEGRVELRIQPDDSPVARLAWTDDKSLQLSGSVEQIESLLDALTRQSSGFCAPHPMHDALQWLRRSAAGWTPEGAAAALRRALPGHEVNRVILNPAPADRIEQLTRSSADLLPEDSIEVAERSKSIVFDHQWSAEWEVDRLRKVFDDEILAKLEPGLPVEVVVMVSEPPQVRRRLRGQLSRRLLDHGISEGSIHVLDAFKPGLSWLMEAILPELRQLDDLSKIWLNVKRWSADNHAGQLDMAIRWLQELFPADELLARALDLPLDAIELELSEDLEPIYHCQALNSQGNLLLERDFDPLWRRIDYLSGMAHAGNVTVTTGGIIARQSENVLISRVLTDPEVFWRYMQGELLPRLRRQILTTTENLPTSSGQPFFEELFVDLQISESDEPYGIREERHSAAEALHEDIYFNVLDFVEELGLSTTGEKLDAPGSVRPFVRVVPGRQPNARIRLTRRERSIARILVEDRATAVYPASGHLPSVPRAQAVELRDGRIVVELEQNEEWSELQDFLGALAIESPSEDASLALRFAKADSVEIGVPDQLELEPHERAEEASVPRDVITSNAELFPQLRRLAERPEVNLVFAAERSYQGRPIPAVLVSAPQTAAIWSARKLAHFKPTLLIVARHHANEVASTTAALHLVELATSDPAWSWVTRDLNVVLLPLENPDGAALHDELRRENPTWKHHPARYNAIGFEFSQDHANPDSPYGESRIRDRAWHACPPVIVVDNHGVPSHEWAQLFAGFGSPPRFGVSYWQVQAQIYGIIPWLELPAHRQMAAALREQVARTIAEDEELLRYNRIYAERYHTWGHRWEPERFPMELTEEMIFHGGPIDPENPRSLHAYPVRYPNNTLVSWVTEVNDETVEGASLERTARAHLLCNRAALELLQVLAGRQDETLDIDFGITMVRSGGFRRSSGATN